MAAATFRFHEFDVPEHLAVLVGGGGDVFGKVAEQQLALLQEMIGISPDHSILEIGCGVGKAAIPLAKILSPRGRYVGVDIVRESIDWCTANISSRYPNFEFVCYDVASHMYNVGGKISANEIRFAIPDHSVDRIFLWSVFTHMLEADVRNYLAEFRRVLKPNGRALVTWFIVDDNVLQSAREKRSPLGDLTFRHEVSTGCFVNVREAPLGAVAYVLPLVEEMIGSSGLKIKKLVRGYWSGYWDANYLSGQDLTVLRPENWLDRLRIRWRRILTRPQRVRRA